MLVATLTDPALIKRLSGSIMLTLSYDGSLHLPCVFPNDGYAYFDVEPKCPEVSPPAVPRGAVGYGVRAGSPPYQEPGKPQGWLGTLEEPRGACASFSESEAQMAGTWAQWEAELARDNTRNLLCGFIDANWLFRAQPIVSANASERWIHLSSALAYGWHWKSRPRDKPFRIYGLLCELDQPGEWHFDPVTNRLYILPENGLGPDAIISVPVAEGFLTIDGATGVEIIGIEVENVGGGTVFDVRSGSNNRILGCHVRNSTATGIALAGRNNGAFGCDLVDLDRHVVLRGGVRTPTQIIGAQNTVENCHIYQRSFRHRKVSVSISGVGNRFRHNLVHNSLGQAVTVSGNDHLIEFNELFNIGYDEGDGGAIYSGGDLAGYGIVYQYNFIHHLMHVPGKVERSGIHLDDLQAGATCVGNVFYKSASKGIFMNGGAGHTIRGNVFLEGYRGVYNVGAGAQRNYERQLAITRQGPSHDHWNTKENYVGRVEKIVGPEGWSRSPWKDRYPLFNEVMSDDGQFGRMWPIRCTVEGNAYYGNTLRNKTEWSRVAPEALAKSVIRDDRVVEPNDFEDYEALDLRQAHPARFALKIPFERIGLYTDEHRPQMPDKTYYRHAIKVFFAGIPSHPGTHRKFDSAQAVDAAPLVGK
ncbi:MAG: right-handed parallel beta-helix repeat-containing protein [Planctomycetota bacterium]|nr:MAG: right-handed parallel beta-helix repeat-containing protein [Planctomycetota bacterium]